MASKITLNVNSIYAVSAIVTVTIGIAVGSVIYCTATAVSGLKERCDSLEKRVDYLDGIVKERDSHTKELFDAKLKTVSLALENSSNDNYTGTQRNRFVR